MKLSDYKKLSPVDDLITLIERAHLPMPEREYKFCPERKWRFDLCWPDRKLALEIEGITPEGGRHQRWEGFTKDLIKYNAAILAGFRLYRVTPQMLKGQATYTMALLREVLK